MLVFVCVRVGECEHILFIFFPVLRAGVIEYFCAVKCVTYMSSCRACMRFKVIVGKHFLNAFTRKKNCTRNKRNTRKAEPRSVF